MTAAYVSSAAVGVAGAVAGVSVTEPAGTTGDLLVAFCWANNTSATWTPPAGWSSGDQDAAAGSGIFYNTAPDAGGTSRTFTRSNSTAAAGVVMVRLSGWGSVAASDIVNGGAASTTVLPSITSAAAGSLLLQIPAKGTTTAGTWSTPVGVTNRVPLTSVTATNALPYCIGDETVGAGATGTRTWSNTNSQQTRGAIIAISPPASQTVSPSSIASTATVPNPTVSPGAATVAPGSIAAGSTVPNPTVVPGAVTVQPDSIPSGSVVGAPDVAPGAVTVEPTGIAATSTVGVPDVAPGAATIGPDSIDPSSSVGAPDVAPGAATIQPPSITSTAVVDDPLVLAGGSAITDAGGIGPSSTVGAPTLTPGPVTVQPDSIDPTTVVPVPVVKPGPSLIGPESVETTSEVGNPQVTPGSVSVVPESIPSGASVPAPTVLITQVIAPDPIGPGSIVGVPDVLGGAFAQTIVPEGIASTAEVGEPTVAEPSRPDECWPVDLSCATHWDDVEGDPPHPVYSEAQKQRAIALAIDSLRMLTGYRVGGCPTVLRPCRPGCSQSTWQTYPLHGAGGVAWTPVKVGVDWLNIGCGCSAGGCSCVVVPEVQLPLPVGNVTQVKIDGVVIPTTAYRLDPGGKLVRTDGGKWPLCQDIAKPDTAEGTWSVTVRPGVEPDATAQFMAGMLAGEFLRACNGDSGCRLPSGVTQIARLGVTLTLGTGAFPEGRTGLREVDVWLDRWNPNRLKGQAIVASPDLHRPRAQGR